MFKLMLNDRELRELARVLGGARRRPFSAEAMESLSEKVETIIDENIDALGRIDDMEGVPE